VLKHVNLNTTYGWFFLLDLLQLFQKVCGNLSRLTKVDQQVCLPMHELHYNAPTSNNDFVIIYECLFHVTYIHLENAKVSHNKMQMFGLNG
jgi:hypothetical protein